MSRSERGTFLMKIESILYVDYEATQLDVMLLFVIWANNDNDNDTP